MKKKNNNVVKDSRKCVLVVKVTAEEKQQIAKFAAKECVNISALVRQLLFERLEQDA